MQNEVINFSDEMGAGRFFVSVTPAQLYGIETNEYAHELAQMTIQIGYIQWLRENGYGQPSEPILKQSKNILHMDAVLAYDENGKPIEPEWPKVDVIIGNPPFLGGNRIRAELGDDYVERLFKLYESRVPATADLVCYWFEKARAMIEQEKVKRVGLLATQGIRGGANRKVLERIKDTGDIFGAQSDRNWILDGATVHVSMVAFDNGDEENRSLDGKDVSTINPNLTTQIDLTKAIQLNENKNICLRPDEKGGAFDITNEIALRMLDAPINVNGKPNSDVIFPWVNGSDILQGSRNMWIIDFGINMPIESAAQYELPFKYVEEHVKPERKNNRVQRLRDNWWIHRIPGKDMRIAISKLDRYIATVRHSKYRVFVWLDREILPDCALYVFARKDDYFFGILHSKIHELWARATGTQVRDAESGFRYTPKSCFETFPFPWAPSAEPKEDPRVKAIAQAAKELVEQRDRWLNAEGLNEKDKKKRTLTNLYNQRPTWLDLAHKRLDEAVFAAYGWKSDLSNEEILEKLLSLNLERRGKNE